MSKVNAGRGRGDRKRPQPDIRDFFLVRNKTRQPSIDCQIEFQASDQFAASEPMILLRLDLLHKLNLAEEMKL